MITVSNLGLNFGARVIFSEISFLINPNDKIGLVGRNGVGKTTLFKLLTNELSPDRGDIAVRKGATIGVLSQFLPSDKGNTIFDETLSACGDFFNIKTKVSELENELYGEGASEHIDDAKAAKLLELQEKLYDGTVVNPEALAEKILIGLGFQREQLHDPIASLSGGWQMRIELAKLLIQEPDLLLLDEPTNHLDIDAIIWFEKYIKNYPKAVILISHDERFLSNCSTRIIELVNNKIYDFKGTLQKYNADKEIRLEQNKSAFQNQQKVLAQKQRTVDRFMAKATKTKMAQSMQKQIDKEELVELETFDSKLMSVNFPYSVKPGKIAFEANNIHKSYEDNHVIRGADILIESGEKVAFVGQNGQGKTTMLKILSNQIRYEEGVVKPGHNIEFSYYDQEQADVLDPKLTVLETLESKAHPDYQTKVRKVLGAFMFSGEDVEKKISVLSGGERARVALACMVVRPSNCLILDEPTNHLDIDSKNVLKQAILDYEGTVLLVSHDRAFLDDISTKTIEFRNHQLKEFIGDINEVLRKRNETDLRDISLKKKNTAKVEPVKKELSRDDKKQLLRTIGYVERDIDKLEKKIEEYQLLMADANFYSSADSDAKIKEYQQLQKDLEAKMTEWEQLQESAEV